MVLMVLFYPCLYGGNASNAARILTRPIVHLQQSAQFLLRVVTDGVVGLTDSRFFPTRSLTQIGES